MILINTQAIYVRKKMFQSLKQQTSFAYEYFKAKLKYEFLI